MLRQMFIFALLFAGSSAAQAITCTLSLNSGLEFIDNRSGGFDSTLPRKVLARFKVPTSNATCDTTFLHSLNVNQTLDENTYAYLTDIDNNRLSKKLAGLLTASFFMYKPFYIQGDPSYSNAVPGLITSISINRIELR